jgi:hypothetical protein
VAVAFAAFKILPIVHWNLACKDEPSPYLLGKGRDTMKQSDVFRENAENCAHLAEGEPMNRAFSDTREWKPPGWR